MFLFKGEYYPDSKNIELDNFTIQKKQNILFIGVDDLRPLINSYGYKNMITPNIDKLAKQGVQFNQAYTNVAVC